MQRRVRRRTLRRLADLQDVLGGVLRVQLEGVHRPGLHRPHARAGRELALGRLVRDSERSS